MRRIRPAGPCHPAGFSLGGIIAWEMARQLGDSGAEVGLVGVIDAAPPGVRRRRLSRRAGDHPGMIEGALARHIADAIESDIAAL